VFLQVDTHKNTINFSGCLKIFVDVLGNAATNPYGTYSKEGDTLEKRSPLGGGFFLRVSLGHRNPYREEAP
jgi:hypothetical protein